MQAWSQYWAEYRANCGRNQIHPMAEDALRDLYTTMLRLEARVIGARKKTLSVRVPIVFPPGKAPSALGCFAEFKRQRHSQSGEYRLLNFDEVFSW
jgi:hypothetical protein